VTNINTGVLPVAQYLPVAQWRSRPGAFSPRVDVLGTGVLGAGLGTGPCATGALPIPHVRVKAAPAVPSMGAPAVQLLQVNNYMTSVGAGGVGTAGPPPDRAPA